MVTAHMTWGPKGWWYVVYDAGLVLEEGRVPGGEAHDDAGVLAYLLRCRWPALRAEDCCIGCRPEPAPPALGPVQGTWRQATAAPSPSSVRASS